MKKEEFIIAEPKIITELHTDTIYVSESAAHEIRRPKITPEGYMFANFRKMYPTAKVVYLSDEEFISRFQKLINTAKKYYSARTVLFNQQAEGALIHFQKSA